MREIAAIVELAEERDRKECIALDQRTQTSDRALAQWLLDHNTYPSRTVATWLNCGSSRVVYLRQWATRGFAGRPFDKNNRPDHRTRHDHGSDQEALKTNDNFEDDTFEQRDDVEKAAHVFKNSLESIRNAKAVAEAWRKIFKVSPFDREAKAALHNEIKQLIMKWRVVQSTLDRKGQGNGQS